jgi:hypothetical protein
MTVATLQKVVRRAEELQRRRRLREGAACLGDGCQQH